MPIRKKGKLGIVDFIHPDDDAIDLAVDPETGKPVSDVEAYKEDWDKSHLVIKEGVSPTIFKINFNIDYNKTVAIKNASIGGGLGKNSEMGFRLGTHASQVVRSVLVDIVNPDDLPLNEKLIFRKDKKTGLVHDSTMEELEQCGIVDDIYGFYLAAKDNLD